MSADSYIVCPVCRGISKELVGVEKLYGKIPEREYIERKKEYLEAEDAPTVPVYYEIILNADGTVSLDLGAECTVCNAKWKHTGVVK